MLLPAGDYDHFGCNATCYMKRTAMRNNKLMLSARSAVFSFFHEIMNLS